MGRRERESQTLHEVRTGECSQVGQQVQGMGRLESLPGEACKGQKPPQMLQIMGIGNQGVWGIIARGEVAEKGRDLWHSGTSVVDELNPQGPVITCDSSNGHRHSSLAIRESIPAWIGVERRRATSTHGSRVGSRRAQRRGTGVSSGLAGRNRSCSPLSGMRVYPTSVNITVTPAVSVVCSRIGNSVSLLQSSSRT